MSIKHLAGLVSGLLLSSSVFSATVYVSDIQFVAIREGQSNNTRAVERGIKSGTPLEVLAQENGHTKVRTPDGNEGWVADYFLSDTAVTRDQVLALQEQLTRANESKIDAQDALANNQAQLQELSRTISDLETQNLALQESLAESKETTAKAQIIVEQNENISYQLESLRTQAETAQKTMLELQNATNQKWFMIGAATLFLGFIMGVVIPMSRRKKVNTSSW